MPRKRRKGGNGVIRMDGPTLPVRLPAELAERLKAERKRSGMTISGILRLAALRYLDGLRI